MRSKPKTLLDVSGLAIDTPTGRPLFRGLQLSMSREQVAIIGRNGVGKSTLLQVLAGRAEPKRGQIKRRGEHLFVPQQLGTGTQSHGQQRKQALLDAWHTQPDLLLLDEPTEALDAEGRAWLLGLMRTWSHGLLVATHDRMLLQHFAHFILLSEAGGRYFQGSFAALETELAETHAAKQKKYASHLQVLADSEWHNARVTRRRARKKRLGRIHELGRCPSKALLNTNRSYAQESQGRAAKIRKERQESTRAWAKATRRALDARLDLALSIPSLPPPSDTPIISLRGVSCTRGDSVLFSDIHLDISRERLAIQGPNGAGKTSLLQIMTGERKPTQGNASRDDERIGYIAQKASNWMREESLVVLLHTQTDASLDQVAELLVMHKFPFSLAERPLRSLSPGERLRAALITLFARTPTPECLLLDEPTSALDFVGYQALCESLQHWPGGFVIASHDNAFLDAINIKERLVIHPVR